MCRSSQRSCTPAQPGSRRAQMRNKVDAAVSDQGAGTCDFARAYVARLL